MISDTTDHLRELIWKDNSLCMIGRLAWLMVERSQRTPQRALDIQDDDPDTDGVYFQNRFPGETDAQFVLRVQRGISPGVAVAWVLLDSTESGKLLQRSYVDLAKRLKCSVADVRAAVDTVVGRGYFVRWERRGRTYFTRVDDDVQNNRLSADGFVSV